MSDEDSQINDGYATQEELISTFDSTSKFWTHLSGDEFLRQLDSGLLDLSDERVQKVLRKMGYVRPRCDWTHNIAYQDSRD
jgi:hypothetical protein